MAVPIHVLTGFLGAGKSTVLARLLAEGVGERVAVLVNEVGELAIDHHLLQTVDDGVQVLASGCVCCTIQGELFVAIERALALGPDRIVVETTGVADPAPIVHGLGVHPRLRDAVRVEGVIAVVDAERGEIVLDSPEAHAQVEVADRVVISKVDLAPSHLPALHARLRTLAPGAAVREAAHGDVDPRWLLEARPAARVRDPSDVSRWLHHHGSAATTRTVTLPDRVDLDALTLALRLIVQLDGDRLLRAKGLVRDRHTGALHAVQSVQHAVFPPRPLSPPPTGWTGSAMVLIARDTPPTLLDRWDALLREASDPRPATPRNGHHNKL